MRTILVWSVLASFVAIVGCGDAPAPTTANSNSAPASPADTTAETSTPGFQPERPAARYDDPRQSVNDFLIAVKSGNDKLATSLLTTQAQKEAWSHGMAISAEGFPDAKFAVTEVEYLKENKEAHVMSTWADKTPYGEQKSFECVWLLRQEEHGWCIYGMATKFLENVQPIILNFENQAEMAKRQQWAEQQIKAHRELQEHQESAISVASQPQAGGATPVRQASAQQDVPR